MAHTRDVALTLFAVAYNALQQIVSMHTVRYQNGSLCRAEKNLK